MIIFSTCPATKVDAKAMDWMTAMVAGVLMKPIAQVFASEQHCADQRPTPSVSRNDRRQRTRGCPGRPSTPSGAPGGSGRHLSLLWSQGSERRRSRAAGSVLKLAPVPLTNAEWK